MFADVLSHVSRGEREGVDICSFKNIMYLKLVWLVNFNFTLGTPVFPGQLSQCTYNSLAVIPSHGHSSNGAIISVVSLPPLPPPPPLTHPSPSQSSLKYRNTDNVVKVYDVGPPLDESYPFLSDDNHQEVRAPASLSPALKDK